MVVVVTITAGAMADAVLLLVEVVEVAEIVLLLAEVELL